MPSPEINNTNTNTNTNLTSISPTQKYTSTPPETLLWLHQLRRNQSATLSRIKNLESSLESFQSQAQAKEQTHTQLQTQIHADIKSLVQTQSETQLAWRKSHDDISARLDDVVGRIGDVQNTLEGFKDQELSRRSAWEEGFEGRVCGVLKDGLKEGFERVEARVLEVQGEVERRKKREGNGGSESGTRISTRISGSAREFADRHPTVSRVSATPTPPPDENWNGNHGDDGVTVTAAEPVVPSTLTPSRTPTQVRREEAEATVPNDESHQLLAQPRQDTQSLSSYMEMGRPMLSQFPGTEQVCSNVLASAGNSAVTESNNTRKKPEGKANSKKRKRREIPIVWSDEDEGEILVAEIERRRRLTHITNTR